MKLAYIIEELISPIVTPFVLIFKLRYRATELIDFFRSNTVDVQGMRFFLYKKSPFKVRKLLYRCQIESIIYE